MSKIHVNLIKGLSEQEKETVQRQYENAKDLLKRFRKIIEHEIQETYIDEESALKVDPVDLAVSIGVRRGLRDFLKYIPE